jgi:hypothetical protein
MKIDEHWESFDVKWKYLNEIKDWKFNEICAKMEKEKLKLHCLGLEPRYLPWDGNVLASYSQWWFIYIEWNQSKSESQTENERESEGEIQMMITA